MNAPYKQRPPACTGVFPVRERSFFRGLLRGCSQHSGDGLFLLNGTLCLDVQGLFVAGQLVFVDRNLFQALVIHDNAGRLAAGDLVAGHGGELTGGRDRNAVGLGGLNDIILDVGGSGGGNIFSDASIFAHL